MALDTKTLLNKIHEQFSGVPYPGDDHIVIENSGAHLECQDIINTLKGLHWKDIPFELLTQLQSALFFLTPEGYRFFMPAFMVYSVKDFYGADTIPDEVIQTLTYPEKLDLDRIRGMAKHHTELQTLHADEWQHIINRLAKTYDEGSVQRLFLQRVSGFDTAQSRVIRQFLEYLQDTYGEEFPDHEPKVAIERYWYQF